MLLQKADALEKINSLVTVPENYVKIIETIEDLMNEVEKELFHRGEGKFPKMSKLTRHVK